MNSGLRIGKILGIPIYLDFSWFLILALITYTLKIQFALKHSEWTATQQWGLGLITGLFFFGSVLFHELAHGAVAKHYKIRVVSITLFFFGGLARIGREPSKAIQEFNIAAAGPLASLFLAACFYGLRKLFDPMGIEMISTPVALLAGANLILGVFNLAPGFPLDGGRIFRAIVWGVTKDFSKATRVAGATGKLIAYGFIAYGIYYAIKKDSQGFVWIALGLFLLIVARESIAQVAIRESLDGLSASDVMSHEVPTVSRDTSLEEYSAEVLRTGRRCHLVVTDDRLVGMMNVHALSSVPRDEWGDNSVQAVMIPRDKILWASPEEPLLRLLERLLSADINQMPVVRGSENDGAQIVGMVTRDSILRVMQTRAELGPLPATK
jgi:Zn-dependent protease/predicted transcriptional regulator